MKKILKKSLACMLAAILCLTACVGAMASVGAEGAITYSIADVAINQGGSDTINVTISNFDDVAGLIAEITLPDAVVSIGDVKLNGSVELVKMTDENGGGHYVVNDKTVKFVGLFNSLNEFNGLVITDGVLTINIDVTVVDEAREAAPITAVFAAGDFNEGTLAVTGTDGTLTVNAVCKHAEIVTENVDVVDATCTTDGSYTIVTKCAACGVETADRQTVTVEATGHAYDDGVETVAPDCENAGVMTFTCANCGHTYTEAIDALGHKAGEATKENEKAADCVNDGSYDMVVRCTVCNAVMSTETTTVPATGHTPAEAVEENRVEAQPGVAGSYDMVVYCSVCNVELSRTSNEIPALPVEPTCDHANKTLVEATPASAEIPGLLDYDCPDCDDDDSIDITVEYNMYSVMQTPDIECTATTNLIFKTSSGLFPYIGNGQVSEGIVVIVHTYADGSTKSTVTTLDDAKADGKTYSWFVGVPGKMMADNYTATLYTKAGDTWYSATSIDASVKISAMAIVKGTGNDKVKKVAANLLVMGAKSQIKFGYNDDPSNLADVDLWANAEYSKYITTTEPTIEMTDENCINKPDATMVFHQTPDVMMEDAVMFRYKMLTNFYADADKLTDMRLELSYEQADGSIKTEVVTDINLEAGSTTKYIASYGVPARYMRQPVSATLYNGETVVAPTVVFSIECLLSTLTAEKDVNLAKAIMNYSDAADDYFR